MSEKPEIVRHVPADHALAAHEVVARALAHAPHGEPELRPREVWGAIRRNLWLILACVVVAVAAAAFLTSRATPVYRASATLKLEVTEPALPGLYQSFTDGSALGTEAKVLQSRTLAESAASALALQLRLVLPRGVAREKLFDSIRVAPRATPVTYRLTLQPDSSYTVAPDSGGTRLATLRPGETFRLDSVGFRLLPSAAHETIVVQILPIDAAAMSVLGGLTVTQAGRDVNILTIEYEDTDPGLVWEIPNTMVDRYLARRREVARAEARDRAQFLRGQLDTLSVQLAVAEDELRGYRERHRAIDPQSEATSQVQRLISMQSERAAIETERTALAQLLAAVDAKAARQRPDEPTPYRELVAFPTLLRSQVATGLLQSLSEVEQELAELPTKRTANDPDLQALTARRKQVETQLRSVVVTYLQGLGNQATTLDTALERFGQQLGTLPQRELEVARLERKPQVLEEISTMLQTRLKEAEIAQAAGDPSVQILDPAAPPRGPFKPNRTTNLVAGLLCGLLLGGFGTFVREYRDRTVHTRKEIEAATGLQVLGLIPTISVSRWATRRIPLITESRKRRSSQARASSASSTPSGEPKPVQGRPIYTFLGQVPSTDGGAQATPAREAPAAAEPPIKPAGLVTLALTQAGSAIAEAYGVLQTNIAFAFPDRSVQIVVVTSALPGEGKTTNAVNLALSLTRRGLRVLLIDADLRRGEVHTAFEAPREPGLTEVLRGTIAFARVCRSVDVEEHAMHYVTAGAAVPSPTALLDSDAMRGLLARVREEYDVTVIDSPPTNIVTDAAVLGAMADGVVLVARVGVTEAGALATAITQLRHVRAPVLGVVLNDIDFKRDAAYDASYRYYNYSQYVSSTPS